ncbi:MAG: PC4/YdbC family ssDNA-binding protein [Clostridiales bacterium]|nr:PC4/YdbC family ssDNA-binding protein [Clostridiales bacterium]
MAVNEKERDEITFEIIEHLGVVSSYPTGWCKELNKVAWNGGNEKYDLRDWSPDHEHMSRGVTLHTDEAKRLFELLKAQKL